MHYLSGNVISCWTESAYISTYLNYMFFARFLLRLTRPSSFTSSSVAFFNRANALFQYRSFFIAFDLTKQMMLVNLYLKLLYADNLCCLNLSKCSLWKLNHHLFFKSIRPRNVTFWTSKQKCNIKYSLLNLNNELQLMVTQK